MDSDYAGGGVLGKCKESSDCYGDDVGVDAEVDDPRAGCIRRGRRTGGPPFTYLFNRGPQAPLVCRPFLFPGTYMIRYAS